MVTTSHRQKLANPDYDLQRILILHFYQSLQKLSLLMKNLSYQKFPSKFGYNLFSMNFSFLWSKISYYGILAHNKHIVRLVLVKFITNE